MSPYGTMIAICEAGGVRFVMRASSAQNARTGPTVTMFRRLLEERAGAAPFVPQSPGRRLLIIQFDDRIHHDIGSVAFCRPRGEAPAVQLVPDPYFFFSTGYAALREAAASKALPSWDARREVVFWRGSLTHGETAADGARIERIEQIPRVALCRALRDQPRADAAIMRAWITFPEAAAIDYVTRENIYRPAIAMLQHANYRYLIDIDGVASAWSFFEKLLLGACVLKIASRFEQWFYRDLSEWQHFIPVRADLGDLATQIEWCRAHPRQTREIAEEGQRFALAHSFEAACRAAWQAIGRTQLALDE